MTASTSSAVPTHLQVRLGGDQRDQQIAQVGVVFGDQYSERVCVHDA